MGQLRAAPLHSLSRQMARALLLTYASGLLVIAPRIGVAQSQASPVSLLPAPTAVLRAEFTAVSAVRELSDGRVLVVDERDRRLVVVDWRAGTTRTVGREGRGAGEYTDPRALLPLLADSTLLPDPRNGRWLLLVGDSIVGQVTGDSPALRVIGGSPRGADGRGYVVTSVPRLVGGTPRLDSLVLIRASRASAKVDTLATVLARPVTFTARGPIDPTKPTPILVNPLSAGEQIAVFADGWIAIARCAPYRVDWIDPNGRRVVGAPLPYERVVVDDREKRAVLDAEARLTGRPPRDADAVGDWPATVPPFIGSPLLAAPDGTLWIRRTQTAANPQVRYDVVDRRGAIVRVVTASPSERIVGFGRGTIITTQTDSDGIEFLRRHPMASPGARRIRF
jgi:hypothetical protein